MELSVRSGPAHERRVGMVAILRFDGSDNTVTSGLERATGGTLARVLASGDFNGRWLETTLLYTPKGTRAPRML